MLRSVLILGMALSWGSWVNADALVAVLPLTTSEPSLEIYERAVATSLVGALEKLGTRAVFVESSRDISEEHPVTISGRVVPGDGGKVVLEAQVRLTTTGAVVATEATPPGDTTGFDVLVQHLASELHDDVELALQRADRIRLPTSVVEGTKASVQTVIPPDVLIVEAAGQAAGGSVNVEGPATQAMVDALRRRHVRVTTVRMASLADSKAIAKAVRAHGAQVALLLEVESVRFWYRNVLLARGGVHVRSLGRDGDVKFDRVVRTGSLVGSRGDSHSAMVYLVAEQALDICSPQIRKLVGEFH